jgi:hypothetical protein
MCFSLNSWTVEQLWFFSCPNVPNSYISWESVVSLPETFHKTANKKKRAGSLSPLCHMIPRYLQESGTF